MELALNREFKSDELLDKAQDTIEHYPLICDYSKRPQAVDEFEKAIAHTNRTLSKIETVFLLTASDKAFISSSIVRDVLKHNGDISALVPQPVSELIASLGR